MIKVKKGKYFKGNTEINKINKMKINCFNVYKIDKYFKGISDINFTRRRMGKII